MQTTKKAAEMTERELASYIDQSVLKPEFTVDDIKRYSQEGIDSGCKTICITPASLEIVAPMVEGTATGICVVCDFPFGLSTTASKVAQATSTSPATKSRILTSLQTTVGCALATLAT